MTASYTCPRCGRTSYNPHDVEQGYCGNCHDWTGSVLTEEDLDALVEEAERGYDVTMGPDRARMIINGLEKHESFWRDLLGDDYERALAHWRAQCQSPAEEAVPSPET